jgi:hypothetical protein
LDIGREATDGQAVYRIAGRIDASTSQDLESAVGPALSGGIPRIIFDMREVTFISSARLGVIVMAAGSGGQGRPFDLQGSIRGQRGLQGFWPTEVHPHRIGRNRSAF